MSGNQSERGVSIPDEAWDSGLACVDWASGEKDGPWPYAVEAINAAAPYIDRAARIDELRRLLNRQELGSIDWGEPGPVVEGSFIEQRLRDLEAQSDA